MKLESLRDLFEESIQDLYSAETQILSAMPKVVAKVTDPRLKQALESHMMETQAQKERLEEICEKLDIDADGKFCRATEGLVKEADELLSEDATPEVLDAGIIASVQKIEHYEIAGYGTAKTFAMHLGETEVQKLLEQSLEEEKQADIKLSVIAEGSVNEKAESAA